MEHYSNIANRTSSNDEIIVEQIDRNQNHFVDIDPTFGPAAYNSSKRL